MVVDYELARMWKEAIVVYLRNYPSTFLVYLGKWEMPPIVGFPDEIRTGYLHNTNQSATAWASLTGFNIHNHLHISFDAVGYNVRWWHNVVT
jgi:hypothetical protein